MNIEIEYQQYILSKLILNGIYKLCNKQIKLNETNKEKKLKYEAANIVERWFIQMINNRKPHEWSTIYYDVSIDDDFNKKMINEIVEKNIASYEDAKEYVQSVLDLIKEFLLEKQVSYEDNTIKIKNKKNSYELKYKEFSEDINSDIYNKWELLGISTNNILLMRLRYNTVLERGQTWSIPRNIYDVWYNKYGMRLEGFASPLNSKLINKPEAKFFSLFPDVDCIFGSIGNFFDLEQYEGVWSATPPFVYDVMNNMITKINSIFIKAREHNKQLTIYSILPYWDDAQFFKDMLNSNNLVFIYILYPYNYYYEFKGKPIIANFKSILVVFSTKKEKTNFYNDIIDAFTVRRY